MRGKQTSWGTLWFLCIVFFVHACFAANRAHIEEVLPRRRQPPVPSGTIAISDLTVLLPHTTTRKNEVRYKLEAYNSCFKWTTSNNEVVLIEPLYEDEECAPPTSVNSNVQALIESKKCSRSAYVYANTQGTSAVRSSSWILAEDVASGQLLKCEVFVDWINRIEIQTTTRTISKDDLELLTIRAFDAEGNVFSSVMGLEFRWSILPPEDIADVGTGVLKFVNFQDATIEVDQAFIKMERSGLETGAVLVQGVETGRARVSSRLTEAGYDRISATVVSLSVLEAIQLRPSQPIYISPATQVQYQLEKFRRDSVQRVDIPNPQYVWSSSNADAATVLNNGLLTATAIGATEVSVQYLNMTENYAKASVFVVMPAYIQLAVAPVNDSNLSPANSNWHLIVGEQYQLEVFVYDRDGHLLYSSDSLQFEVTLSDVHFSTLSSTPNNARHVVKTQEIGTTVVSASLTEIYNPTIRARHSLPRPITVRQDVYITSPVKIQPPNRISLPYIPGGKIRHQYTLKATGGSGDYNWFTADNSVMSMSAFGVVVAQNVGQTTVSAADKRNPLNRDSLRAVVSPPSRMQFIPAIVEVPVGHPLTLPVGVYDQDDYLFDNCSAIPFTWTVHDPEVFAQVSKAAARELPAGSCAVKVFQAMKEGQTLVRVSYDELHADVVIFAFNPLQVTSPENKRSLVTLGSSATVSFFGGPLPWYLDPRSYEVSLTSDVPENVHITKLNPQSTGLHSYLVTCLAYGDQQLHISVGNRVLSSHPFPVVVNTTVDFSCQPPDTLYLYPTEQITPPSSGAGTVTTTGVVTCAETTFPTLELLKQRDIRSLPSRFQIRNNRLLPLNVTVFDQHGRMFDNFTSLVFQWSTSNDKLAGFLAPYGRTSRILKIDEQQGSVTITVAVEGYDRGALQWADIRHAPALVSRNLHREFQLILLPNVKLSPDSATLFNHANNKMRLLAEGGSGNHRYSSNNTAIARLDNDEIGSSYVDIVPLAPGVLEVTATDVCLGGSEPSSALVVVSDVAAIRLAVRDMAQVGEYMTMTLDALDSYGRPFDDSQYRFMEFSVLADSKVVSIEREGDNSRVYRVKANQVGIGRITASTTSRSGKIISSKPAEIYVFAPFRLVPRQVVLLPGASFQIQTTGGPPVRAEVIFSVNNETVTRVDEVGMIDAGEVGHSKLTATIEAYDSLTGVKSKYGVDSVDIIVRHLTGIRIHSSTSSLMVGNEITVRVVGLQNETPFTYGSVNIQFEWESTDTGVASLRPIYEEANVALEEENGFSVRVYGKAAGRTRIQVRIQSSPLRYHLQDMSAHTYITVVEPLRVLTPSSLLLPPNSGFNIETNKDNTANLVYETCGSDNLISVDKKGHITAHNIPGTTYVIVRDISSEIPQSAFVQVHIKPVQQLQLLPRGPHAYYEIPLGSSVEFKAILRDDMGETFHSYDGVTFDIQLNKYNFISARPGSVNGTVAVKALLPGESILRVSVTDSEKLDDYIKIRVGHIVSPVTPLVHLGGKVQFSTSLEKVPYMKEDWFSDNAKIFSIDAHTARGVAHSIGKCKVYHNSTVFTYTTVTVVKVGKISLDSTSVPASITNALNATGQPTSYRVKLLFFDDALGDRLVTKANIDQNIQFDCNIVENNWAYATPVYDPVTFSYYCVITPLPPPPSYTSRLTDRLSLDITVQDEARSYSLSNQHSFNFVPAFVVRERRSPIILSPSRPSYIVEVQGHVDVVSATDKSLLKVMKLTDAAAASGLQTTLYEVQALRHEPFTASVEMWRHDTEQKDKIDFKFDPEVDRNLPSAFSGVTWSSLVWPVIFTLAALTATVGYWVWKQNNELNQIRSPQKYLTNGTPGLPPTQQRTPMHAYAATPMSAQQQQQQQRYLQPQQPSQYQQQYQQHLQPQIQQQQQHYSPRSPVSNAPSPSYLGDHVSTSPVPPHQGLTHDAARSPFSYVRRANAGSASPSLYHRQQ